MCHVKRNFVEQGRTVNLLQRSVTTMTQEIDRLKAAIEALKIEKRNLDQVLQTTSTERDDLSLECETLAEKLENAEAQVLLVTE
jgi:chromosome segregation ATPase